MDRRTKRAAQAAVLLLIIVLGVIVSRQERNLAPPDVLPPASTSNSVDADLKETLARIDRGERLRFRNDGSVFENRERRLPKQPRGYYREWVHPMPGMDGPGPRRIITGTPPEAWYTPDHYQTFERVR
jgi:guanyl-specific ribonuclease Sa